MKNHNIAVVVGHDKTSPGAYSIPLGMSEYLYNSEVAPYLSDIADIYYRPLGGGYKTQMRKLADQINPLNYDLVLELHFNSFEEVDDTRRVEGCEAVIYRGNGYTQLLGEQFCEVVEQEHGSNNRGVKEVLSPSDRGYWFLYYMNADAMILEGFFGDEEEALKFKNPGSYAELIKKSICGG